MAKNLLADDASSHRSAANELERRTGDMFMEQLEATEHIEITNSIYQDIVDGVYEKEYFIHTDLDFANRITQNNKSFLEKSSLINQHI